MLRQKPDEARFKPNLVDRIVMYFDPRAGLERLRARFAISHDSYRATKSQRNRDGRNQLGGTGDFHLNQWTLWELREIARELDRNRGLSVGLIDRTVENILGPSGFALQPDTGDDGLNETLTEDFNTWVERDLDARGEFHGMQVLRKFQRAKYVDGDTFAQLDPVGRRGNGSLVTFEGDRVLAPASTWDVNGYPLINGVARDKNGVPKFYTVAHTTPRAGVVTQQQVDAIPAEQILHYYNPRRMTQTRSNPIMTPVIEEMDDLDDLLTFERIGAKLVAAMGFFVESEDPMSMADLMSANTRQTAEDRIEEVSPGGIYYLKSGQKITSVQSNRPNSTFDSFVTLLNRYVGLPLGLPLELVLLDFSRVNFSSSRQLLHVAQLHFLCEQFELACFLSKVYTWWLGLQVARGRYRKTADFDKFSKHGWGTPGWPSPNPLQDAQANQINLEIGVDSRTRIAHRSGSSIAKINDDLAREAKERAERGIAGGATSPAAKPDGKADDDTETDGSEAPAEPMENEQEPAK